MSRRPPQGLGTLSAPVYKGAIPQCEGPKLDEFPHRRANIDYRTLLSDPESNGQAHVFEVRIGSRNYALKIVCPCILVEIRYASVDAVQSI